MTGTGAGAAPDVELYDGTGARTTGFYAHSSNTGARVASGDLNGDGQAEIITAEGPGAPSHVVARSLDGAFSSSFQPYGSFHGGVNVAAGDVDGDNVDELITAADAGGGPHVIVWDLDGSGHLVAKLGWYAYAGGFRGGVNVALSRAQSGDYMLTAPASWGGPHIRALRSSGTPIFEFTTYGGNPTNGVNIAFLSQVGTQNSTNQNSSNQNGTTTS
ncbi:MAG: VCBS repeat-containing protein [Actinobacteria bacterium]|nr:VCBS repeat-containing protein [Actinomycetota bacterium]